LNEKQIVFPSSLKAKILTTPVRFSGPTGLKEYINVFRGLKSEPDAEIGEKSNFRLALTVKPSNNVQRKNS
jgi:hypothetical protein